MVNFLDPSKPIGSGIVTGRGGGGYDPARRFRAAMTPPPPEQPSENPLPQSECKYAGAPTQAHTQPQQKDPATQGLTELRELWDELVTTLQAGRRLSSEQWTLRLRLDDAAYPTTTLELTCAFGTLSVTLRTASESVYARILSQLPELNERLKRHASASDAIIELVPLEDIES
jgi:hypothetical protein